MEQLLQEAHFDHISNKLTLEYLNSIIYKS